MAARQAKIIDLGEYRRRSRPADTTQAVGSSSMMWCPVWFVMVPVWYGR